MAAGVVPIAWLSTETTAPGGVDRTVSRRRTHPDEKIIVMDAMKTQVQHVRGSAIEHRNCLLELKNDDGTLRSGCDIVPVVYRTETMNR